MSLLLKVIYAAHCRSTHHKLAMDALKDLRCPRPQRWREMFLRYHEDYLTGAKDPDTKFRDFRNHVLHVEQNNWGGAIKKTREWFDKTVDALKHRDWQDAAYCTGVMSHYYTDPLMPFHTGQSQAENNIHRATEWSICKTYEELRRIAEVEIGLPEIEPPRGSGWLEAMVIEGAEMSHRCYDALVKQYDFAAGSKNPPAGLNDKCRMMLAKLLGHAAVGLACIIDEAIEEADIRAPRCELTVATFIATVKMPARWITNKLADAEDRAQVEAMFQEFEETGKVEKNLPEDDRVVRELVKKELGDVVEEKVVEEEVAGEIDQPQPTLVLSQAAPVETREVESIDEAIQEHEEELAEEEIEEHAIVSMISANVEPEPTDEEYDEYEEDEYEESEYEETEDEAVGEEAYDEGENVEEEFDESGDELIEEEAYDEDEYEESDDEIVDEEEYEEAAYDDEEEAEYDEEEAEYDEEEAEYDEEEAEYDEEEAEYAEEEDEAAQTEEEHELRFYLERGSDVVDAPSIGNKTAKRLRKIGVRTVNDLLNIDPDDAAAKLNVHHITAEVVADWQDQAALVCCIPQLRGHDAQILVACGYRDAAAVAVADVDDLLAETDAFAETSAGERVIRSSTPPDYDEVANWITWAQHARPLKAA